MAATAPKFVFSRWTCFSASAWVQTCAGLFYCFSLYSPAIKAAFDFNQAQIQGVGAALLAGAYFALPGGWLYEHLAAHPLGGPRLVSWLGVLLGLLGYGGMYAVVAQAAEAAAAAGGGMHAVGSSPAEAAAAAAAAHAVTANGPGLAAAAAAAAAEKVAPNHLLSASRLLRMLQPGQAARLLPAAGDSYTASAAAAGTSVQLLLLLCAFCAGVSGNLFDTAALVTNVKNFPNDRGTVIGCLKAMLGLGPSLFAAAYHTFLAPHAASLLLLLAFAPAAIVGLCSVVLQVVPLHCNNNNSMSNSNTRRFTAVYTLIALLALNQLVASLLQAAGSSQGSSTPALSLIVAACMLLLVGLAAVEPLWQQQRLQQRCNVDSSRTSTPDWDGGQRSSDDHSKQQVDGPQESEESEFLLPHLRQHQAAAAAAVGRPASSTNTALELDASLPGTSRYTCTAASAWLQPQQQQQQQCGSPDGTGFCQPGNSSYLTADAPQNSNDCSSSSSSGAGGSSTSLAAIARSSEFWLIFFIFAVGAGAGLMFTNNLPEIVDALAWGAPENGLQLGHFTHGTSSSSIGGSSTNRTLELTASVIHSEQFGAASSGAAAAAAGPAASAPEVTVQLVSLFSIGSCAGRLLFGYFPELLLTKYGIPRPVNLSVVSGLTGLINLACALVTSVRLLYPIAVVYGIAFGAHWCLVPAISSEVYGLEVFAKVYTALIFAPAVGCWLLAAQLAGRLYDAMSSSQLSSQLKPQFINDSRPMSLMDSQSVVWPNALLEKASAWPSVAALGPGGAHASLDGSADMLAGADAPACIGPACFRITFVVLAALCAVAVAASVTLTSKTAAKYKKQLQPL